MVFCEGKIKRVNIVGAAPGWWKAPEDNGYIWAINNVHLKRDVDLVIDIHRNRMNPTEEKDKIHMSVLEERDIPTYAVRTVDGKPHIMKYPLEEIIQAFGVDYFGSGFDYMIALAIYKGFEEIHLYGVWMKGGSEYAHQKPSAEYWIGFARGRGIKVEVHGKESTLLKTRNGLMYGYQIPQQWVKEHQPEQAQLIEMLDSYESFVCN